MPTDPTTELAEIHKILQRLESDIQAIKKAVVAEAKLEEQELEIEQELEDLEKKPDPRENITRYREETLDEVEKELGG